MPRAQASAIGEDQAVPRWLVHGVAQTVSCLADAEQTGRLSGGGSMGRIWGDRLLGRDVRAVGDRSPVPAWLLCLVR